MTVPTGLFLKIFLWFWLAMSVVGGVFVISAALTSSGPPMRPWRALAREAFAFHMQRGIEVFEAGGVLALREHLDKLEQKSGMQASLFDSQGREISGRDMTEQVDTLLARAQRSGKAEFERSQRTVLVAQSVTASNGENYTLVGRIRGPRLGTFPELEELLLRLLAVVLTGGVVCYGLARYLTSPLSRLQKATQMLAAGNLKTRVGRVVEKRSDEFGDLGRDFDVMAGRIESLVGSQRRLLSDISHELRSPLARLNVALELARKQAGSQAAASLDRIGREAERMNDLIGQLLRLARLENGAETRQQRVAVAALVREVVKDADFEANAENRSVRVIESQECSVSGSEKLLRSAIENVVRNAVSYTAENTQVEVSLRRTQRDGESCASISVRDHGPGVPSNELSEIFRAFYRVAEARDRQSGGTGLGLAITERIVRLHGGVVRASNAPGRGLIVEMRFPLQLAHDESE